MKLLIYLGRPPVEHIFRGIVAAASLKRQVARRYSSCTADRISAASQLAPAPGVITVTEFEETDIREAGADDEPPEES